MAGGERPTHGARKRCSDPTGKGCRGFARRNSDVCAGRDCGGGTRAEKKHHSDGTFTARGLVSVPPRIQQLLDGTLDISELDDEELARGYPRAADGSFRNPPIVIPRSIHNRMMRELFQRSGDHLKANLRNAVEVMTNIANNEQNDPNVRLKAAQWVVERVMGKTPDVSVTVDEKKYQAMFDRLERNATTPHVVVEGEVVVDGYEP